MPDRLFFLSNIPGLSTWAWRIELEKPEVTEIRRQSGNTNGDTSIISEFVSERSSQLQVSRKERRNTLKHENKTPPPLLSFFLVCAK